MNNGDQHVKKAIHDLVETYERGLAFLINIETNYNSSADVEFIARNSKTLRSNEKLISLYGSILEESVSNALEYIHQSSNSTNVTPLNESACLGACDTHTLVECNTTQNSETVGSATDVEEKCAIDTRQREFYREELVDLANQHVRFKETVTLVNFTTPTTDDAPKRNSSIVSQNGNAKKKTLVPKNTRSLRNKTVEFQRKLNRTVGLCNFCDEQKSFTKLQWQKHLLSHTGEYFYFCKKCESSFNQRTSHTICPSELITDIYEHNNCAGTDYLAAFMCKICNYVRVNESKMLLHLQAKHKSRKNKKKLYKKINFVTNVV